MKMMWNGEMELDTSYRASIAALNSVSLVDQEGPMSTLSQHREILAAFVINKETFTVYSKTSMLEGSNQNIPKSFLSSCPKQI
jgi:hypothetical protein